MTSIKLPYPHPGQQAVREQAERHNWLSAGRRWRKTTLIMSIAVETALEGKSVIWGAPTYDQVRIGWRETRKAAGGVFNFTQQRMTAECPSTGGYIIYRSLDDPDNVRGHTADRVLIDEAGMVKEAAWYEVLRPMLIDTGGGSWGVGTPNGRNWFWQEYQKASDSVDSIAWQVPTLGVKVTEDGLVRDPHPLENPDIKFDEIKRLYETMPTRIFDQEMLAQFIDSSGGVFRRVMEAATATEQVEPVKGHQYIAGVDVAALVDFTVCCVIDVTTKEMVYMDRFNRVDYTVLEDRLAALYRRFGLTTMVIEDNSIGRPVIDHLVARNLSVQSFTTTNATKTAIIQSLQGAFEHDEIKILNDPVLIGELQAFEGHRLSSGWRYEAPAGLHDDAVMSLAIAWHGVGRPSGASLIDFV